MSIRPELGFSKILSQHRKSRILYSIFKRFPWHGLNSSVVERRSARPAGAVGAVVRAEKLPLLFLKNFVWFPPTLVKGICGLFGVLNLTLMAGGLNSI